VFAVGTLSTTQVKELCRRQLLARTSAASDKFMPVTHLLNNSGVSTAVPVTQSFSASQASPASVPPSPNAVSIQQRSPSFTADEQICHPVVEPLRPMDSVPTRPSLLTWHMPETSCVNSIGDADVGRSPRPASNSADSSDGTFAVVSLTGCHKGIILFSLQNLSDVSVVVVQISPPCQVHVLVIR